MDVGIRELKARLSEYLDRAERGEVLRVTHRGRPKAIIGPVPLQDRIERGIAEGWIKPGSGELPAPVRQRFKAQRTVEEMLEEDRGE
jgi:prevent-host-death family protein